MEKKVWVTYDRNIISQKIHQENGFIRMGKSNETKSHLSVVQK